MLPLFFLSLRSVRFFLLLRQIINDVEHKTLAAGSTKALKLGNGGNIEAATAAGKALGEAAKVRACYLKTNKLSVLVGTSISPLCNSF